MFGLFGSRKTRHDAPPVVVPESAIRPGEDDHALVRALADYIGVMRREGGWAASELDPAAMLAHAANRYLGLVAQGGHAAYVADPGLRPLRARAQEGLERIAPGAFAETHAAVLEQMAREQPAARAIALGDEEIEALAGLDAAFEEAGGRTAIDPMLAGWIARLDGLEVVPDGAYAGRLVELSATGPEREARQRDLAIAEFDRRLTSPLEAGVAVILGRTTSAIRPVTIESDGVGARDDGLPATEWRVDVAEDEYRAVAYSDRLVVFRPRPDGEGFAGLGHLAHDKIGLACAWAERGNVALAARLGLEALGAADRLRAIVFDRRKQMKKTGAEAAAFHLSLDGMRNLALVVFPKVSAIVDPNTNERLAQFEHSALQAEAEAHGGRLAALES